MWSRTGGRSRTRTNIHAATWILDDHHSSSTEVRIKESDVPGQLKTGTCDGGQIRDVVKYHAAVGDPASISTDATREEIL